MGCSESTPSVPKTDKKLSASETRSALDADIDRIKQAASEPEKERPEKERKQEEAAEAPEPEPVPEPEIVPIAVTARPGRGDTADETMFQLKVDLNERPAALKQAILEQGSKLPLSWAVKDLEASDVALYIGTLLFKRHQS
jgi:hypothetical protein